MPRGVRPVTLPSHPESSEGGIRLASSIETRHLTIRRRQRLAVRGDPTGPSELWFVLHGYGQTAPRFLRHFEALDDGSRLLVAPEGLHRHYLDEEERKVGASWMTSEDRLTDIGDYVDYLDQVHRTVVSGLESPPGRIVALGFSQGVHTLARWLALGEARIDAAAFWGSHLPPDLDLAEHAERMRRAELLVVAGSEDPHFGPDAVARVEERLEGAGIGHRTHRYGGGHRLDGEALLGIAEALATRG